MIIYTWRAKDLQGQTRSGRIEATDMRQAARILRDRGLVVVALIPKNALFDIQGLINKIHPAGLGEVVAFTRQLSTMINAGLPLTDSLVVLRDQTANTQVHEVVADVLLNVEGGSTLASALAKHPRMFSKIYVSLVKAGETAGVLDKVLLRLSDNLEKEREFKGKVKGALIYPAMIILAMLGVGFVMMVFVIPKLTSLYKDLGSQLPLPTQILIFTSGLFVNFWWLIIGLIFGFAFGFIKWKQTYSGQRRWDRLVFRIPIIGNLVKQIVLTEFARTLSLLIGAGVPIIEALNIVGEAVDNSIYQDAIIQSAKMVERGFPLALPITQNKDFPPILGQMIKTGEQTGKLDEILMRMASFFETESEQAVKGLTTAIEPIIMIILGIAVAFMILSIIMPIYQLTSSF